MASIPSLHRRNAHLNQIDGSMPRLNAIPTGCAFNPRCGFATDLCREHKPGLPASGHAAACHFPLREIAHG